MRFPSNIIARTDYSAELNQTALDRPILYGMKLYSNPFHTGFSEIGLIALMFCAPAFYGGMKCMMKALPIFYLDTVYTKLGKP